MNSRAMDFFKKVQLESCRIQFPDDVVFLCGGQMSQGNDAISFRDFLYPRKDQVFEKKKVVLAERAAAMFDSRLFDDLLQFEEQIASISRLILVICESPGAISEVSAFSQIKEISNKLLVLIHSDFYAQSSFIKDGPIRFLERMNEASVQELDWAIGGDGKLIAERAKQMLQPTKFAITNFLRNLSRTEKFDVSKLGHKIFLVGGVIQTLACSKISEIEDAMGLLGVPMSQKSIKMAIFCLELFGWVKSVKRDTKYYVFIADLESFIFRDGKPSYLMDVPRSRFDIVAAYEKGDPRLNVLESLA
jgi:hypothetical protein